MKYIWQWLIVFFFILSLSIPTFASSIQQRQDLLEIPRGEEYATRIDATFEKYKENDRVLNILNSRIEKLSTTLENLSVWEKKKWYLNVLLAYLDIKVQDALDALTQGSSLDIPENIPQQEDTDKKVDQEDNGGEDIQYPGFSTEYNDEEKNILAWMSAEIFAGWVNASIEDIDVEEIVITFSWSNLSDIESTIASASLIVEGYPVWKASSWDIKLVNPNVATLAFDNIENFTIPQKNVDFRIIIDTNPIWFQKSGKLIKDIQVLDIDFIKSTGRTSDRPVWVQFQNEIWELFHIVPAILETSVKKDLSTSTVVELNVFASYGKNTIDNSNSQPTILLKELSLFPSINPSWAIYTLTNIDDSSDNVIWTLEEGNIVFDLQGMADNNRSVWAWKWENYRIVISNTDQWVSLSLAQDGIVYDVIGIVWASDIKLNAKNSIYLWFRDF